MGALDAPVQGASFYVRKLYLLQNKKSYTRNGVGVGYFQVKVPSHILNTNPSDFIMHV